MSEDSKHPHEWCPVSAGFDGHTNYFVVLYVCVSGDVENYECTEKMINTIQGEEV